MSTVGQPERATQDWVIPLLRGELHYPYIDDWIAQPNYNNIEFGLLVRDHALAPTVSSYFRGLIDRGLLGLLPTA
jgi:hypothetical protein